MKIIAVYDIDIHTNKEMDEYVFSKKQIEAFRKFKGDGKHNVNLDRVDLIYDEADAAASVSIDNAMQEYRYMYE